MERRIINSYWTKDRVWAEALKYSTRINFQNGSPSAYNRARRCKLLDKVCSHMICGRTIWTREVLAEVASKYSTRGEFKNKLESAYAAARLFGIMDDICSHMIPGGPVSKENIIYIWQVGDLPIYKIGLTSDSLGDSRIREVSYLAGFEANIIRLQEIDPKRAKAVEKKILKLGNKVKWNREFSGYTEFRFWTSDHLDQAKQILADSISFLSSGPVAISGLGTARSSR